MGDAASCDRIQRDEDNGSLWQGDGHVIDLNTNIGSLATKGWDVSLSYSAVEMGRFGELNFNLTGTVLDELTYVSGVEGLAPTECEGKFGVHSAAFRARNGGITSAPAGRHRGTWISRSPGVTTTA